MNLTDSQKSIILRGDGQPSDSCILQGLSDPYEANNDASTYNYFLRDPKEWLSEHRDVWDSQFPERSTTEIVIGCSDPRLHGADLRYPGLGGFEPNLDKAANKIIALRTTVLRHCEIVLQTHDNCGAMKRALQDNSCNRDPDEFAQLWGRNLAELITQKTGDARIRHTHLPLRQMKPQQDGMNVIYVDCTDRLQVLKDLPFGPTVSLLNPRGIAFNTGIALRHLLGNGLDHHLMPNVRFMVEHLCGGESSAKSFSEKNPLTIVLVRDRKQFNVSNIAQRTVEDFARKHYGRIKVLPIDQRGTIYEPLST